MGNSNKVGSLQENIYEYENNVCFTREPLSEAYLRSFFGKVAQGVCDLSDVRLEDVWVMRLDAVECSTDSVGQWLEHITQDKSHLLKRRLSESKAIRTTVVCATESIHMW